MNNNWKIYTTDTRGLSFTGWVDVFEIDYEEYGVYADISNNVSLTFEEVEQLIEALEDWKVNVYNIIGKDNE